MFSSRQINILSSIFTAKIFRELSCLNFSLLKELLYESRLRKDLVSSNMTLGSFFELIFKNLSAPGVRNEYIYKSAIAHKRLLGVHSLNTAVMLNEFRAGASKADVVVFNDTSTVYEIKSERDSLARLSNQIADYQKVFLHVNVITSEKQISSVSSIVPKNVGILSLTNRYQISTIRAAKADKSNLCAASMFSSLRRKEAETVLGNLGVKVPEVPNTQLFTVMQQLFGNLDILAAHNEMVKVLKASRSQASLHELVHSIPKSMQAGALSTPLNKTQQKNLIRAINMPLHMISTNGKEGVLRTPCYSSPA